MDRKYIEKIKEGSNKWELYKNISFDNNFYNDKKTKKGNYRYFYLNKENRDIFNVNNGHNDIENINYYMLRDYQKESLQHILKNRKVILNLPVRFGKTYLSITAVLNNKKNTIFLVDPNMIEEFKNTFSKHGEENVFIYYEDKNKNIFDELNSSNYKIIITTEETFISRIDNEKISKKGLKNLGLIENIVVDEYHNFVKKADKRYKKFKGIIKKYFKNIDIFMLMSATPTNEYIFNVFYSISLLDENFIVTDWLNKCSIVTRDHFKKYYRQITNEKCLKGIIEDSLYTWNKMDPFCTLKIQEIFIEHDKETYYSIYKEKNNIERQKIIDDYRLVNNTSDKELPKKIDRAISILKENKNKKIVVFAYFKESQKFIKEDLKKINIDSEHINSNVSNNKRLKIIDEFQNGNLNVVVVEIKTAVGITLDKADIAIMICDEYEPQKYYQALGRIISTDYSNPTLKNIYWIYDKNINSKQKIEQKINILERFGISYSPFNECDVWVYFESESDKKLFEKIIGYSKKYKLFNRNKSKFNPDILSAYEQMGLNYIFICDNDKIVYDYKLVKRNLKFITYNELFGIKECEGCKNIEDILLLLNCYKKWQINIIKNCDEKICNNYKEFIYSFENIEKINDKNSKNKLINFLDCFVDKNIYNEFVDDMYVYIRNAILFYLNVEKPFKKIKNIIKSYFMEKIDNKYIKEFSKLVIANLEKKLEEYKLEDFKKYIN